MALGGALVQRNWAAVVYPWLVKHGWVDAVARFLETVSKPLNPYVVWKMDAVKCPINSYEWYFITMMTSLLLYWAVSALTHKENFNLERMLHRGKYALDEKREITSAWSWKNVYNKLIGITPEYSRTDKVIAWSFFIFTFIYQFAILFLLVLVWNQFSPWPMKWWSNYFYITNIVVPGLIGIITTFWFGIGGIKNLIEMFKTLETRVVNHLDNGTVDGNMSLADKAELEAIDAESGKNADDDPQK
jgi:hypothetical protein